MKNIILFSFLSLTLFACNNTQKPSTPTDQEFVEPYKHLYGYWVGDFESVSAKDSIHSSNKINIVIKSIIGDQVIGQSIVAGNKRPLTGKIDTFNNQLRFVLTEPGNDKYDGKFEFEVKNNEITGIWTAFDESLNVTERKYVLKQTPFTYNANAMLPEKDYLDTYSRRDSSLTDSIDGQVDTYTESYYRAASENVYTINSSTYSFKENELKNYKKLDLQILRNTIFARHGYTFKKRSYRQFFDVVDWYVPVTDNVDGQLTAIEKANIKLLSKFEKYAEDNYDTFGR